MNPTRRHLMIGFPLALMASGAGYFLFPWLGLSQLPLAGLFSAGIGLGIILGMLLKISPRDSNTAARQTARAMKQALSANRADNSNEDRITVFVGNLAYRASPRQLRELFEVYGTVHSVRIATDRETRKPRGFGFVEMNASGATQAIQALHGNPLCNRELNLSEAKQRENS